MVEKALELKLIKPAWCTLRLYKYLRNYSLLGDVNRLAKLLNLEMQMFQVDKINKDRLLGMQSVFLLRLFYFFKNLIIKIRHLWDFEYKAYVTSNAMQEWQNHFRCFLFCERSHIIDKILEFHDESKWKLWYKIMNTYPLAFSFIFMEYWHIKILSIRRKVFKVK